jgi:hypothetical protein
LGIFTYLSFSTPHLCLHQLRIEFDENPTLQELRDYCFQDQLSKQETLLANLLSRAQRFHESAQLIFDGVIRILGFITETNPGPWLMTVRTLMPLVFAGVGVWDLPTFWPVL